MKKQQIQIDQKKIENRALTVTVIVNVLLAAAGVGMYFFTGLTTMFIDGMYSTIALMSTIIALLISIYSKKKTKNHPGGLYFMEPLYALLKVFMIFTVLITGIVLSVPVVIDYFVNGEGQVMDAGAVPWYAIFATSVCLGLSLYNRIQYKKTNCTSTMLRAESQTNLIDGLQSAGIGIAFLIFQLIPIESAFGFLHYTGDFFITLVLIVISVKDPVILLLDSFRELTDGIAHDKDIYDAVEEATGLQREAFSVFKMGMKIRVCIPKSQVTQEDIEAKEKMLEILHRRYETAEIVYIA